MNWAEVTYFGVLVVLTLLEFQRWQAHTDDDSSTLPQASAAGCRDADFAQPRAPEDAGLRHARDAIRGSRPDDGDSDISRAASKRAPHGTHDPESDALTYDSVNSEVLEAGIARKRYSNAYPRQT